MGKNHAATSERATVTVEAGGERPSFPTVNSRRQSIIPPAIKKHYCDFVDHSDDGNSNRYKIGDLLGCGAFGQIYSAFDRNIGRKIAIKSPLPGAMQDKEKLDYFLHEAQITASLQHPNIMPIYDLDTDSNGRPYFTMRQIEGISLGEAIDRAAAGNVPPEIRTYTSRVNIILKVLDAISYVHSCGIIHQDIKPDNIMLGKFGEVMVSDWGTASFASEYPEGRLIGTPLFMPPEQAQHGPVGVANDIYALGATFYNLLTWQYPMDDQDSDRFWDRKFNGVYNDLPPEIERDVPPVLLDIARKAMSVRIEDRYPSADAMARDLRRYLEGSPVSAHHDNLWEMFVRNFRHHRRAMIIALLLAILLSGLGGLLLRERQRRLSDWRLLPDVDITRLTNDELNDNWEERSGTYSQPLTEVAPGGPKSAWHIRDGVLYGRALVTSLTDDGNTSDPISNLTWGHNIFGGIRVEMGVTPFDAALNLNCFIAGVSREDSYVFHIGGWSDPLSCVLTRGKNLEWITESRLEAPLDLYQEHDIRMEYDGGCVRLFINQKKIIEYHDSDPLNGISHQTFGLETDSHARAISNLKVYQKPAAEMISPLETADVLAYSGEYERAIDYYDDLLRNYPDADYAPLARYRIAACLDKLGRRDEALRYYREIIAKAPAKDLVRLNALITCGRIYLERSDAAKWSETIDAIAATFPGADASKQILDLYSTHLQQSMEISSSSNPDSLPKRVSQCLEKVQQLNVRLGFGSNPAGINYTEYAYRLWLAGYPDVCLRLFPWRDYLRIHSLEQMGAYQQIAMETQKSREHAYALVFTGQISRAISTYPHFVPAYVAAGDFAAAWKHARTHSSRFWLLLLEGRFQEAQSIAEDAQEKFTVQALRSPDRDFIEVIDSVLNQGGEELDAKTALFITEDLQRNGSRRLEAMRLLREILMAMENPASDINSLVDRLIECFRAAPYRDFCHKNWSPEFAVLLACLVQHAVGNTDTAKNNLERLRQLCAATPYRYSFLLPHIEYLLHDSPPEVFTGRTNTVLPYQQKAALLLTGAWKADLAGDMDTARRAYREWAEIPPQMQTMHYQQLPFLRRFVNLRLNSLE